MIGPVPDFAAATWVQLKAAGQLPVSRARIARSPRSHGTAVRCLNAGGAIALIAKSIAAVVPHRSHPFRYGKATSA